MKSRNQKIENLGFRPVNREPARRQQHVVQDCGSRTRAAQHKYRSRLPTHFAHTLAVRLFLRLCKHRFVHNGKLMLRVHAIVAAVPSGLPEGEVRSAYTPNHCSRTAAQQKRLHSSNAFCAKRAASSGSFRTRRILCARAGASPGCDRSPVRSCETTYCMPSGAVVTTGVPVAKASITETGILSRFEAFTKMSA